jgi:C-terminal region of Mon2 protein
LRDEVLPYSGEIPHQFILNIVVLLNKGSIHSATAANPGCETEMKLREEFAKTCFETLLQFSLLDDNANKDGTSIQLTNSEGGVAGQLAITALLHRFEEVLKRFNDDERQSGKCPLPRYRLSEISFVLKAVATLVISMKKAPPTKGKKKLKFQRISFLNGFFNSWKSCVGTTHQSVSIPRRLHNNIISRSFTITSRSTSSVL